MTDERPDTIFSRRVFSLSFVDAGTLTSVVCANSPLYRCLQTATPLANALDLPISIEHGVGEFYLSITRGLHPRALQASELVQHCPRIDPLHQSLVYPSQRGESMVGVHDRANDVLTKLISQVERNDTQNEIKHVVIFTHAATLIAMGRALTNDPDLPIRSGTCSIGKYKRLLTAKDQRGGLGIWEQTMNGETSFLEGGEERHWEFSYIVGHSTFFRWSI